MDIITLSDSAVNKVAELLLEEDDPRLKLRIFVQGGGCAGFTYGFTFDTEIAEDDTVISKNGVDLLVDSMSYQYLAGAEVDYKESIMGSNFVINNPNAQTTCGCGSSFSTANNTYDYDEDDSHGF